MLSSVRRRCGVRSLVVAARRYILPGRYDSAVNTSDPLVPTALAADLLAALGQFSPSRSGQTDLVAEYRAFLHADAAVAVNRSLGREHVTASCFVFSPDFSHVLLTFHKKGQFWVQFGGHLETVDASIEAAALREAREESGITALTRVGGGMLDLDRHGLGDGFARCAVHWDVGYAATASADASPLVSDESDDVAWWPVDALPTTIPPGFAVRLLGVLAAIDVPQRPAE